jgi:oxygen-independent coproporphyrinogen-3 oxidase
MKDLSLYIHIPFCKNICHYCNFLTFANKNRFIPAYLEALKLEIRLKTKDYKNYRIETVYFGGGTPSLLEADQLEGVLEAIRNHFYLKTDVEVTVECNPESINTAKLKQYLHMGITRISLGVQSFDKKALFRIARPHDYETILKALEAIRAAGVKNFGADFILGLPYQTFKNFQDQLKQIIAFDIPHLSFYFLSYDTKRIDLFKADCPTEDIQVEMYLYLIKELKKAGYRHYEVSNYTKPGFECRHNLRYWHQQEYLGLGLGAHSYLKRAVFENPTDFDSYLKNPHQQVEKMPIDDELHRLEYIMLHLRTAEGIWREDYEKCFGGFEELREKARNYVESGHMTVDVKRLRASEKGFLILDKMTNDLL